MHARCAHRGTTLYYGKVEERGIRCCYHGWLFDVEGHCLEQPCEPEGGRLRDRVRQPWYPVQERYGLIFAYMGPPEKKPVLPRYECLEVLDDGEFIDADDTSIGSGGDAIAPCNWLQHFENVLDTYHVPILHGNFSGTQFTEVMNQMPKVTWDYTERGVKAFSTRTLEGGKLMQRTTEVALPTLRVVPNPVRRRLRPGRKHRLDAADRRHALPHLHGRPRAREGRVPAQGRRRRDQPQALARHDAGGAAGGSRATGKRRSARARSPFTPTSTSRPATRAW